MPALRTLTTWWRARRAYWAEVRALRAAQSAPAQAVLRAGVIDNTALGHLLRLRGMKRGEQTT